MVLDPSLILAGRNPDIVNALAQGQQAGQQMRQFSQANALAEFEQAHAGAVLRGDPSAMATYAGLAGTQNALAVQSGQLGLEQGRLGMRVTEQNMQLARAAEARAAEAQGWAGERMQFDRDAAVRNAQAFMAEKTAAEQQAAREEMGRELSSLADAYNRGDRAQFLQLAEAAGLSGVTPENYMSLAPQFQSVLDALDATRPATPEVREVNGRLMAVTPQAAIPIPGAPAPVAEPDIREVGGSLYAVTPDGAAPIPGIAAPAPEPSDDYQRYVLEEQAAGRQPLTRIEYARAIRGEPPSRIVYGADGQPIMVEGDATTVGRFTEGQSRDNVYVTRATAALNNLDALGSAGVEALTSYGQQATEVAPFGLGRGLQSDEYQVARREMREFVAAILRKDTGAAVTPSEEALYFEIYAPLPGEGPAVIEAKRQARLQAVAAIEAGMNAEQLAARDRALVDAARRADETTLPQPVAVAGSAPATPSPEVGPVPEGPASVRPTPPPPPVPEGVMYQGRPVTQDEWNRAWATMSPED